MMIDPDTYYEFKLKGKSVEQIISAIKRLKREITSLKRTMEHPNYICAMRPSEETRLWCTREYLERAKVALAEAGGVYTPTKYEKRVAEFESSIPMIQKITFSIGGFFGGYETHTIVLDDVHLHKDVEHSLIPKPTNFEIELDYPMTKDEFLGGIRELHIGEWRKNYNLCRFGCTVYDGTQWELKIEFSNGHKPIEICGDNAYPYNFDKFKEIMGIEFEVDDEENGERNMSSLIR